MEPALPEPVAPKPAAMHLHIPRKLPLQLAVLAVLVLVLLTIVPPRARARPAAQVQSAAFTAANASAARSPRVFRAPFYLKTHKTGSSTIAHHLLAYARANALKTLNMPGHIYYTTPNAVSTRRADAIVAHHFSFDVPVIRSYMNRDPDLIVSSVRLPLQRQISWFRQQNKQFEAMPLATCAQKNETFLSLFDKWLAARKIASQFQALQERHHREELAGNITKILDQFDFVFVKERLRESFECFCEKTGVRLCHPKMPLAKKNLKPHGSCVEKQLLSHRAIDLLRGDERDLLLYEEAGGRLGCRVSEACRCPEGD